MIPVAAGVRIWIASGHTVSGALAPPCIELPDPEDTHRHFWIGSHIWLTI